MRLPPLQRVPARGPRPYVPVVPVVLLAAGLAGCGGAEAPSAPAPPTRVTVVLEYERRLPPGPPDATVVTGCQHHFAPLAGGVPAFEASWSDRIQPAQVQVDALFRAASGDVPVGQEQVVRVYDLELCGLTGSFEPIAVRVIRVNGVELTRVVRQASGLEGAAFTVDAAGGVRP